MTEIIYGNIRVQFVQQDVVRIEYAKKGKFCDENTFVVPDRGALGATVNYKQNGGEICFGEYQLCLPENSRSLTGVKLVKHGKKLYSYKKLMNSGELPAPEKTPEAFAIADNPRILVPAWGYSYKNKKNNGYKVQENVQDVYLFLCDKDAKKLRQAFVNVMGKCELVRLATLGSWNSKYFVYDENSAKQVILDYEKHDVPLDNLVIDTDWRAASDRGIGYDVDTKLFPDMARFLRFAHEHGVEVMFNDHPEPVDGATSAIDCSEVKYREEKLQSLMKMGLDTWWYDRNWHTKLKSPTTGVMPEAIGIHIFDEVTKHFYQKQAKNKQVYRRPVIMANVDNIANGCYLGINSSATHRSSIQWTGDVMSEPIDLTLEVENLVKGGNSCIPYVNADCGGHQGNPEKEGFIRWMQFGTLSPVFRPHCTNTVIRTREPWVFDEQTLNIVRAYNKLRYRLLPYIYQNAFQNYETGEPIFKSLVYNYPDDKKSAVYNEYMLGDNLLMRPIGSEPLTQFAPENYKKPVKATFYDGYKWEGQPILKKEYKEINFNLAHTQIEPEVPVYNFSAEFETSIYFDDDVRFFIKSDDCVHVWLDGKQIFEDKIPCHSAMCFPMGILKGGKEHALRVKYNQQGGEASCGLYYCEVPKGVTTYLPAGKWLNPFNGRIYAGGKKITEDYSLKETPLYIRLGALIPLAYEAQNTSEQKWDKLVYDFYPCKDASDEGYLYEDDGETTAYKLGKYRTSEYAASYLENENAFVVSLKASEGGFDGARACSSREASVQYHALLGVKKIAKVTVNGQEVAFKVVKKDENSYPLHTDVCCDGDVVRVSFTQDVTKDYEIKFYLG